VRRCSGIRRLFVETLEVLLSKIAVGGNVDVDVDWRLGLGIFLPPFYFTAALRRSFRFERRLRVRLRRSFADRDQLKEEKKKRVCEPERGNLKGSARRRWGSRGDVTYAPSPRAEIL